MNRLLKKCPQSICSTVFILPQEQHIKEPHLESLNLIYFEKVISSFLMADFNGDLTDFFLDFL
jgi:hypothetical protein